MGHYCIRWHIDWGGFFSLEWNRLLCHFQFTIIYSLCCPQSSGIELNHRLYCICNSLLPRQAMIVFWYPETEEGKHGECTGEYIWYSAGSNASTRWFPRVYSLQTITNTLSGEYISALQIWYYCYSSIISPFNSVKPQQTTMAKGRSLSPSLL